jgi:hypothetical protein
VWFFQHLTKAHSQEWLCYENPSLPGNLVTRVPGNALLRYVSALFSRLVLFFNCFLRASTCFDNSISSSLATCAALAAL